MTSKETDSNTYRNCKSYNGEPAPEGTVLVPVWITDEIFNSDRRIIHSSLVTWKFCGCPFRIGFAPIKEESFADYMNQFFWPELNEEIARNRPGRCIVGTAPDGSPRLCPKANLCTHCDKYGTLPRRRSKKMPANTQ